MKSFLRIILLTVTMATFCVSTYAQKSDRQRMTREQLAEFQAEYIAKELEMDDMTTQEYSKFLSQKQIGRVYELERKMMDHLFHRSQKEKSQKK